MTELPAVDELLTVSPLYVPYRLPKNPEVFIIRTIRAWQGNVDCFCPQCGKESTFQHALDSQVAQRIPSPLIGVPRQPETASLRHYMFNEFSVCARDSNHRIVTCLYADGDCVVKIGQCPSAADLAGGELAKYRRVLGDGLFLEFRKAIGLKAHGVGVDSYVYLRRVIERLLEDAHVNMKNSPNWDEVESGIML